MATTPRGSYEREFAYPVENQGPVLPLTIVRRISWGAVFAGVAVILALQLLLTLLGLGIGLATLDPASGDTPEASSLGIGGGVWALIVTGLSVLIGAWVAGRLAGSPTRTDGMLHGVVTWAAATMLAVYFITSTAGSILGTTFSTLGSAVQAVGQGAQSLTSGAMQVLPDEIRSQAERLFQRAPDAAAQAQQQAQQAQQATGTTSTVDAVRRVVSGVQEGASPQDRDAAINLIAQQAGIPREEAERRLNEFQTAYRNYAQQARQSADAAADAASKASFAAFIALVIGIVLGAIGGAMGTPRELYTTT